MTTRSGARRHKGSTSYKSRGWPPMHPYALETFKHWNALGRAGFVYFIREDDGPIKIGQAHDPLKRALMLQCGNPRELTISRLIIRTSWAEKHLHAFWASAAIRGEWFGKGQEQAILDCATRICDAQIEADREAPTEDPHAWSQLMHNVFVKALFDRSESEAA